MTLVALMQWTWYRTKKNKYTSVKKWSLRNSVSHTARVISVKYMMFFQELIGFLSSGETVCSDPKQIEQLWNRLYVCNVDTLMTSGTPLDPCKSYRRSWIHPRLDPGVLRSILTCWMGGRFLEQSDDTMRQRGWNESCGQVTLWGQWWLLRKDSRSLLLLLEDNEVAFFFPDTEAQLMTTWTTSYFLPPIQCKT